MLEPRVDRVRRTPNVEEDWCAWLPEAKHLLFASSNQELEVSYHILSVTLNDAFTLCQQQATLPAREQAVVFSDLFDRLSDGMRGILRALYDHGREFGTLPNVAPLRARFFRSERAQQIARTNNLLSFLILRSRTRFFRKLGALEQVVADLDRDARQAAASTAASTWQDMARQWKRLEILHYDLNTCLCETTVMLKSFLCVLPSEELKVFRTRLLALVPAIAMRCAGQTTTAANLAPGAPSANQVPLVPVVEFPDHSPLQHHPHENRDNAGSGDRITTSQMRPDGTGGPNETN